MKLDDLNLSANHGGSGDDDNDDDAFYRQLMSFDAAGNGPGAVDSDCVLEDGMNAAASSIVLDGPAMERMSPSEIFIVDFRKYCEGDGAAKEAKEQMAPTYFRCIVPEEAFDIVVCPSCQLLFRGEEFEVALINNGHLCPFCRFSFSSSSPARLVSATAAAT